MVLHEDSAYRAYQNLISDLEYEQVQQAHKSPVDKGYFKRTDSTDTRNLRLPSSGGT